MWRGEGLRRECLLDLGSGRSEEDACSPSWGLESMEGLRLSMLLGGLLLFTSGDGCRRRRPRSTLRGGVLVRLLLLGAEERRIVAGCDGRRCQAVLGLLVLV